MEWLVLRSFAPGVPDGRREFSRFHLARLPILLALIAGVVLIGGRSFAAVAAFCAGVVLTQSVIVLKALGLMILRR